MDGLGDLFYLNGRYDFFVLFSILWCFFFPIKSWQIITAGFSVFCFSPCIFLCRIFKGVVRELCLLCSPFSWEPIFFKAVFEHLQ